MSASHVASPILSLPAASWGTQRARVHPVVVLSVLDHYQRRPEGGSGGADEAARARVIGTLLGVVGEGGDVDVRSCFPVNHSETRDQAKLDIEFHRNMVELHRRANPKEIIVGWYATGSAITQASMLIHEFYSKEIRATLNKELQHPVHLTVDTDLTNGRLSVRAYTSSYVGSVTPEGPQGFMFLPLTCDLKLPESERMGLDLIARAKAAPNNSVALLTDLDNLERSVETLQGLLATAQKYVDDVISGAIPADPAVGRQLMDAVASVPKIDQRQFEQVFNSNLQDLLMVVYLSNLTRTQLAVAERLQSLV